MLKLFRAHPHILVCLLLAAATVAVYWQVHAHEFVSLDDAEYLTENLHVQHGFTRESVAWTFNVGYAGNWHPLTWLSHMLDWRLYGADPAGHHLTNVLLHVLNVLLLFLLLSRMTGSVWRSAFVAAIFAIHPLHVESVAWAAERKDVLSALFWILTIWAYVRYTDRPRLGRYLIVVLVFGLGLMAKPMLATLPAALLVIDYWPLGRLQGTGDRLQRGKTPQPPRGLWRLALEKVPLFALVGVSAWLTVLAQSAGEALRTLDRFPLGVRLANAAVSYVAYLAKTVWPANLSSYYIHPESTLPEWQVVLSAACLLLVTALVFRNRLRRPYLLAGWLWYVLSLLPVIGIVQVGSQAFADRYMYLPMIGLTIMIAWGIPEALARYRFLSARSVLAHVATAVLLSLCVASYLHVGVWRDSVTLFSQEIAQNPDNDMAHSDLGAALIKRGEVSEAIPHLSRAVELSPSFAEAHNNLAYALEQQGDLAGAIQQYYESIRAKPGLAKTHNDLGISLCNAGRVNEGIAQLMEAVHLDHRYSDAHTNLGVALASNGRIKEAIDHLRQALRINPNDTDAQENLDIVMASRAKPKVREPAR